MKILTGVLLLVALVGCASPGAHTFSYSEPHIKWVEAVDKHCREAAKVALLIGFHEGLDPEEAALFSRKIYFQCMNANGLVI